MKKRILIKNKARLRKSLAKKIQDKKKSSELIQREDLEPLVENSTFLYEKKNLENFFPGLKELPLSNLEQEIAATEVQQTAVQNTQQFTPYGKETRENQAPVSNYFSAADYFTSSAYDMKVQGPDQMIQDTHENMQNSRTKPFSNEISFNPAQNNNYCENKNKKTKKRIW